MLAFVIYEEHRVRIRLLSKEPTKELNSAFRIFDKWINKSARL